MIPWVMGLGFLSVSPAVGLDTKDDVAFQKLSQLVGGVWEGSLGKMTVRFTYRFAEGGKMIEGIGHLTQGEKPILNMESKYGWDPISKQTYYIDFHGYDVVYSGHVLWQKEKLVIDFKGLIGDMGHWITYATMASKDRFAFNMYEYKGSKLVPTHVDIQLHRH
ncbi:MAG: hypothetical protein P4L46_04590 [Fimbriimonas sp.]|nr:hypothetical protein [Fimbriimonas sp.]